MLLRNRPTITLSDTEIRDCIRVGPLIVQSYANGDSDSSLAFSGAREPQNDPRLQAHSRMAEFALCRYLGFDPACLSWYRALKLGRKVLSDGGYDLLASNDWRVDIKSTKYHSGRLIWPLSKNCIFADKPFDVLFLITGEPPEFDMVGWCTKTEFRDRHFVADENDVLDYGTWYMRQEQLREPQTFPISLHCAIRAGRQFDYISRNGA